MVYRFQKAFFIAECATRQLEHLAILVSAVKVTINAKASFDQFASSGEAGAKLGAVNRSMGARKTKNALK